MVDDFHVGLFLDVIEFVLFVRLEAGTGGHHTIPKT